MRSCLQSPLGVTVQRILPNRMDLGEVKSSLEPAAGGEAYATGELPARFYEAFILHGLNIDLIEHGHVVCSMTVAPRLVNSGGILHGSVIAALVDLVGSAVLYSAGSSTSGVSVEISFSCVDQAFVDEEIVIDAKLLRFGRTVGVSTVEVKKKKTGEMVAHGRHCKYLAASSRL
ncbi:hypothetical protein AXF42_Ash002425 [Apostasia shenzhenica]|uniref:Acyl-coenzyme A thioesterase 13 n=1 Tax=Apostasia shenzhenica TaxID=1088818 RepID=A0A2I0ANI7_9ASPA|nr:hypothetical protein AXF42_Ash002425 [Apostasia shenzhenica]